MRQYDAALVLKAVSDRMIPGDEWPSASDGGVLTYLERRAAEDVTAWTEVVEPGLRALDEEAYTQYGWSFSELLPLEQDQLLREAERDNYQAWPVSPTHFFRTLLNLVVEGYYGNPDAGGNRGGKSWEMLGFRPGPIMNIDTPVPEVDLPQKSFDQLRDRYDAIVIGAGAGGSVAAAVLAEAGLQVLVVERGSWLRYDEVGRDHLRNHRLSHYGHNTGPDLEGNPRTIVLAGEEERVTAPYTGDYHNNAMTVGGGTRVYGAQAWRFHPNDFRMASRYGVPEGSSLSDWPIRYEDLEPYYDRAEWEIGVSGDGNAHSGRGNRERPFPMPAMALNLDAQRLARAAEKLGWETGPVPLLINSVERDGRPACVRCGECVGFACPTNSKNGGHNTMLVRAMATGNCDLICDTMAERIDTEGGKHATGVRLVRQVDGVVERRQVRAGHVVVAAGAIESARLLLGSATDEEPDGIGNRSGQVGRHLQGHVYAGAYGLFDEVVQDGLGPGVSIATFRFDHSGEQGVIGGGLLANEFTRLPLIHWYRAVAPNAARWGIAGKRMMRDSYLRTSQIMGPIQEIPNPESRVSLSKTVKDRFGIPAARLSGSVHPESLRAGNMLGEQAEKWLWAAGAREVWRTGPYGGLSGGQHQAGTLRMGNDPMTSVTDPLGRIHGYDNLWVSDGSVHVTNGGVNPVLTIMALAFRTAENLVNQGQ
ncbi:choline dehydrogenase-like flavoprotein [Paenibacillus cellulosilyticus]|uniref:Choline dehydrogenase-like flavoprotein n=1 Tax=Paenibacillus cellulosilyticus TaxID=375489 RepID=A0A2V2YVB1_9BACL|nr:GMC family oxidoreductase [Paenibacillus cellulosilyticus]PWW05078.1 choline dehydrogenase-like flavoprotein [Paenibacillus cellulosilyticus]QKS48630.1 gluconate 2-dehydrogenase subunit 3 family protein [Paenibacillus cellulosilyticus]